MLYIYIAKNCILGIIERNLFAAEDIFRDACFN